jgi:hypothetical protein
VQRLWVNFILAAGFVWTSAASAGVIIQMDQTPVEIAALQLDADGQWMRGRDWDHESNTAWMRERWIGGLGSFVEHATSIQISNDRGLTTPISFMKEVDNETNFLWRAFEVRLIPGVNSTITNVQASLGDPGQYNSAQVITVGDGSFRIFWIDPDGGADNGVAPLETGLFNFSFDIEGDIQFHMQQFPYEIPVPEPTSMALLAAGAMLIARRNRR